MAVNVFDIFSFRKSLLSGDSLTHADQRLTAYFDGLFRLLSTYYLVLSQDIRPTAHFGAFYLLQLSFRALTVVQVENTEVCCLVIHSDLN